MDELLGFLEKYEVWIYVLLGITAVFYLQRLIQAWSVQRNSVFGLEKESARRRLAAALTVLILLALLIFGEFFIVSFIAPSYSKATILSTPTLDLLATPTATLPPGSDQTPTVSNLEVTQAPLTEGCISGQIEWISPRPGDTISATVELKGTVNVPNLGFYKYEFSQPGSDTWTTIAAGNKPMVNGSIGFWNTSQLGAGDYRLRLVVADNQNKLFPACVVQVRIVSP